MSVDPHEQEPSKEYDFGLDEFFDASRVSYEVIWPLVQHFRDGVDWAEECELHDKFQYPKRDTHNNRMLHVLLSAECKSNSAEGDEWDYGVPLATLRIEYDVPETGTLIALDLAREAAEELAEEKGVDLEDVKWPTGDEDNFMLRSGQMYTFEENGDLVCAAYRNVVGPTRQTKFPLTGAELEAANDDNRLRRGDIQSIDDACIVLNSPQYIFNAIDKIRSDPINSN